MLCKIADLLIDISATGDLSSRCRDYIIGNYDDAEIVISDSAFKGIDDKAIGADLEIYYESGRWFYGYLLNFSGLLLHSSAVELDGKAYLFSGPSTVGKSTHTKLWQQIFGERAQVFNDDKPALRRMEDGWYAYGTPWCGKDGINQNKKVPLAGICFLKQGDENRIRRLNQQEAIANLVSQTIYKFKKIENLDKMLTLVDQLVREIPIYELTNRPEPEAARLSYETMRRGAEEAGL